MRSPKVLVGVGLSLIFLYLTIFSPRIASLFAGDVGIGEALFGKLRFSVDDLGRVIATADWRYIFLAGLFFVVTLFMRAWRWRLMLNPLVKMRFSQVFGAMCIGYMANNVLPLRMGELYRAQVVFQLSGLSRGAAFGSIVLERLIDLLFMAPFIGAALLLFPLPGAVQKAAWASAGAAFLLTGFFVWLAVDRSHAMRFADRMLGILPEKVSRPLLSLLHKFTDGLTVLGKRETFASLAISSLGLWTLYTVMVFLVMKSVGLVSPEFPQVERNLLGATLVTLVMTTFGFVIPGAPGAVGTYHGVAVLGLSLFGVPGDRAVGFAILLHGLNYLPLTVLGLVFFARYGFSFGGSKRLAEQIDREIHPDSVSANPADRTVNSLMKQ